MKKGFVTAKAVKYLLVILVLMALLLIFIPIIKKTVGDTFTFLEDKVNISESDDPDFLQSKYCYLTEEQKPEAENLVCCREFKEQRDVPDSLVEPDDITQDSDPGDGKTDRVLRPQYSYADIPEERNCKYVCGSQMVDAELSDCEQKLHY